MRKTYLLLTAALCLSLGACNSKEKETTEETAESTEMEQTDNSSSQELTTPADTQETEAEAPAEEEFTFTPEQVLLPAELKGHVEVIETEKGLNEYGFPEVTVTFKLLSKVNTEPLCSQYGQMWIVGMGQKASGADVKALKPSYNEWRSQDSNGSDFKKFLESEPGETITLDFTGDKDQSKDVAADLKLVEKFKLKLTN